VSPLRDQTSQRHHGPFRRRYPGRSQFDAHFLQGFSAQLRNADSTHTDLHADLLERQVILARQDQHLPEAVRQARDGVCQRAPKIAEFADPVRLRLGRRRYIGPAASSAAAVRGASGESTPLQRLVMARSPLGRMDRLNASQF
jgi:hypothetical protein